MIYGGAKFGDVVFRKFDFHLDNSDLVLMDSPYEINFIVSIDKNKKKLTAYKPHGRG